MLASAAVIGRRRGRPSGAALAVLLLGTACLAVFALRDAETVLACCALAFLAALALQSAPTLGFELSKLRLTQAAVVVVESGLRLLWQPLLLFFRDLPGSWPSSQGQPRRWMAIAGGLILSLPVLLVFGALLRSADPLFARLTDPLASWEVSEFVSHVVLVAALTWISAGFLRGLLHMGQLLPLPPIPYSLRLGPIPVAIPLATLALILAAFAAVQARYLFGGIGVVLETAGLTIADYARRGFFELVAVATLVLAMLWLAHGVLDRSLAPRQLRSFRMLAFVLLVLVGAVMASAIVRLRLYVQYFGLTEARVHATAFIFWLAAAMLWFAATVLRGRPERFLFGTILGALAGLLILAALDPQDLVARTNLERVRQEKELDAAYLAQLDADAVPAVVASWPLLDAAAQCLLWEKMLSKWQKPDYDWRRWNLARQRARAVVARLAEPVCAGAPPPAAPGRRATRSGMASSAGCRAASTERRARRCSAAGTILVGHSPSPRSA
jgi:hypothetical protein